MPQMQLPFFPAGVTEIKNQLAVQKEAAPHPRLQNRLTLISPKSGVLKVGDRETDFEPEVHGGPTG